MQNVAASKIVARRKDEVSKLLAEKEAECNILRARRNALAMVIAELESRETMIAEPAILGN